MSDKMREEFEWWAIEEDLDTSCYIDDGDLGDYCDVVTQYAWLGWQASRTAMVKDGWQLVPRIPTDDMKKAFHQAESDWEDGYAFDDHGNRHYSPVYQWVAMLNAAPKP